MSGRNENAVADEDNCFHCGLPVPAESGYVVTIEGAEHRMCCPGCQAVAQAIVDNGLTEFYRHRSKRPGAAVQPDDELFRQLDMYDQRAVQKTFVQEQGENVREASLILEGIVCAACVWLNERHVRSLPGVLAFQVNYTTHRARLRWDDSEIKLSDVLKAITAIGYVAHPFDPGKQEAIFRKEKRAALKRLAVAGLGAMQVMMLAVALYAGEASGIDSDLQEFMRWVSLVLATPVVLYSGQTFFRSAWRDVKRRHAGMDVPVVLAVTIAFVASVIATVTNSGEVYFDSVTMFIFFLLASRFLEMSARHRAGEVAEALVKLLPETATRITPDGQEVVSINELEKGDRVLVRPGESVPADGCIVQGRSSVDESLLTGESMPLTRTVDDELIGGSVNIESPLTMRVEKTGQDTQVSAIVRLLERAQAEKPDLARLADRVAGWFVTGLLLVATVVGIAWWFHDASQMLPVLLSVLVVTCPCALSLATPTALTVATGSLTRDGLLTTRGNALETLAKVNHIVFDKTGTLTRGQLSVVGMHNVSDLPDEQVKRIAASLEQQSEHPLAQALTRLADPVPAEQVEAKPGEGLEGVVEGKLYRIGSLSYAAGALDALPEIHPDGTLVVLANESDVIAWFELADVERDDAAETVQQFRELGIQVSLLSGDVANAVQCLADRLGIPDYRAACKPEDKVAYVKSLQRNGEVVAMVGDGVNDAPVLAGANVSVAMGAGTQLAQSSADMVVLSESLLTLVNGRLLAERTVSIIRQNFGWAVMYNVSMVPMAAMGWIAPWMAAIGMSLSSLVVVFNSLRLKKLSSAQAEQNR